MTLDPDRPDFTFEKLVVFDLGQADMTRFQAEAGRDFTLIDRGGGMTEAVLLGNSKSTGIHRILDHYHLSREAAFAFGDSANDLPMFQCVATPHRHGRKPSGRSADSCLHHRNRLRERHSARSAPLRAHLTGPTPGHVIPPGLPLMPQKPNLLSQAPGIAREAAPCADHPVAGNDQEMGLCPTAPPTAWAAIPGLPVSAAIFRAISP